MKNPITQNSIIRNKKDLQPYDPMHFLPLPIIPKGSFGKITNFAYNIIDDTHFFVFRVEFDKGGMFIFSNTRLDDIDILSPEEYATQYATEGGL